MNSALPRPPTVPRWVTAMSGVLSLLGLAGLVLTGLPGFETPNPALLATSGALTLAFRWPCWALCRNAYAHDSGEAHVDSGIDRRRSVVGDIGVHDIARPQSERPKESRGRSR